MSLSSTTSATQIVANLLRKGINLKKSKLRKQRGPNPRGSELSLKNDQLIRTYNQVFAANRTNINVSTGASTWGNPTSTVSFAGCTSNNITSDPMFAMFFTLADMPQSSTFTALYDVYRINEINVTFTPTQYPQTGLTSSSNMLNVPDSTLWYCVDVDDAGVVSPLSALQEYESVKHVTNTGKPFTIKIIPHVAQAAYGAGAFTSYSNTKSPWIDCASSAVQHYGLKFGMGCPIHATWGLPSFTIYVNYNVSFRGVR